MESEQVKRPFGIYAIMVLQLLNIAANFFGFVRLQMGMSTLVLPNVNDVRVIGIVNIVVAVLLLLVVWGLWRLKYWAWFSTMVLTGIALIFGIWQYWHGATPYASLLINALIVFYLNQNDLRRLFEGKSAWEVPA